MIDKEQEYTVRLSNGHKISIWAKSMIGARREAHDLYGHNVITIFKV
jgi:hypothetical protein